MAVGDDLILSADCKIYRNTGTHASPTWNEIEIVSDASRESSYDEADVTVRGSGKKRRYEPTLEAESITFTILEVEDDADFLALLDAKENRTAIEILWVSGDRTVAGHPFVQDHYKIFGWTEGEPLNGATTINVTIKPCWSSVAPTTGVTA